MTFIYIVGGLILGGVIFVSGVKSLFGVLTIDTPRPDSKKKVSWMDLSAKAIRRDNAGKSIARGVYKFVWPIFTFFFWLPNLLWQKWLPKKWMVKPCTVLLWALVLLVIFHK